MKSLKAAMLPAAAVVFAMSLLGSSAKADTLQFTVVDGVNTVTFDLPQGPAVPSGLVTSTFFEENVQVDLISNGVNVGNRSDTILFSDPSGNTERTGDLNSFFSVLVGGVLFTGSNSDPTFKTGAFGVPGASITITDTSATPLPAALPLLASGLGALGLLGWRKKRRTAA
jgi:hypothetical protein